MFEMFEKFVIIYIWKPLSEAYSFQLKLISWKCSVWKKKCSKRDLAIRIASVESIF